MLTWRADQSLGGRARLGRLVKVRCRRPKGLGLGADQKRAVARVIRVGRLPIVALAAAFLMVGCGGSTETGNSNPRSDNNELRQENGRLDEEVQR